MVIPDNDALKPALYQGLVEGFQVCGLLFDEILQLVDAGNLCVPGGSVNRAFLALLPELEDLIGGILLSASDHLCDVLLELCLVGGLIAKERVDGLNYHIL